MISTRREAHETPSHAEAARAVAPVIVYPQDSLPQPDLGLYGRARALALKTGAQLVAPREAECIPVRAGQFLRISCPEGPQVGDLNLWSLSDLNERFYSGKTRALHGTHLSTGDRLWSGFPHLRPLATVTADTLDWYGTDAFGGRVHDVIGTRCDPYTNHLLNGTDYHHCCHSNLTRALARWTGEGVEKVEDLVHDVLNVFMCTGFTRDTGQYFMKATPARQGDYIEFFAEVDLLAGLSACPGGDCGAGHSSDVAQCHPLLCEVYAPPHSALEGWEPPVASGYTGGHGA